MLVTVVTILIVTSFKTTFNLGMLTTIFSACSIISVYIFQRKIKRNINTTKICTIMMIISFITLLIDINKYTVIIYNLFNSLFLILLINSAETKRYEIITKDKKASNNYIVEHQILSEICLNIARILGYIVLLIASVLNKPIIFKIMLIIITIIIVIYSYLLIQIEKE